MIVACQSRSSLKSYFETLNGSAREEYKLFKAECKNLCYDEVRSFYGLYVSNEKVTAATDYASAERLLDKFPFVGAAMITKIMEKHGTWTSCCDVLSSMVSSHGNVIFDSSEFFIGNYDWPSVQESIRRCSNISGNQSTSEDWSIFELPNFDDLHVSQVSGTSGDEQTIDGTDARLEDWEIIESISLSGDGTESPHNMNDKDGFDKGEIVRRMIEISTEDPASKSSLLTINISNVQGRGCSYRDVLKTSKAFDVAKSALTNIEKRCTSKINSWTPIFEVVKVSRRRVDRLYGHHEAFATAHYNDIEDSMTEDRISSEMEMFVRAST